ncbi:MAG: glycosyltransferase family 4 protein, partial [Alphaproteobacteria bacterium]|nr:glycosyltransferase family 4 protein [Alphaproteobacteria bacterium]
MKCLWLTFHDPSPAHNGQYLYSEGLIESVAASGVALDVVAISRPDGIHRNGEQQGHVRWHLAEGEQARWKLALSAIPQIAMRSCTRKMHDLIEALVESRSHDAIVFDSICTGWALPLVRRKGMKDRRLVHIAHNHELTVARHLAFEEHRPFHRVAREIDALKVARLEGALVRQCDVSTSNTPEDLAKFRACYPGRRIELLRPGYSGPKRQSRAIDGSVPRRAIIVGSFDWPPKRSSLEDFLEAAASPFARKQIELHVVGSAEQAYLARLRERFPSVTFTGAVPDVYGPLSEARVALVPDYLGGFKLKSLDYIFSRVPVFALSDAIPGVPLRNGESVRLFDTHDAMVAGVTAHIDAVDLLNRQQEAAYAACERTFDWATIAATLR